MEFSVASTPDQDAIAGLRVPQLSRDSVSQKVYETLHEAILSLRLRAGTRLIEADLARQFGVSTTPIREALQRLAQSGLVDRELPRGMRVHQLTWREIKNVYELRALLEPQALRQSAPHLASDDFAELSDLLESAQTCLRREDFPELSKLNSTFHHKLMHKADNELLLDWIGSLKDLHRLITMQGWAVENRSLMEWEEHKGILEAVRARRVELAADLLGKHIASFGEKLLAKQPGQTSKSDSVNSRLDESVK